MLAYSLLACNVSLLVDDPATVARMELDHSQLNTMGQIHYCLAPNCSTAKRPLGACCARAVERRI